MHHGINNYFLTFNVLYSRTCVSGQKRELGEPHIIRVYTELSTEGKKVYHSVYPEKYVREMSLTLYSIIFRLFQMMLCEMTNANTRENDFLLQILNLLNNY